MTAQYTVESLLVSSAVVDTYVAAPQGMAIKLFLKLLAPSLTAQPGFSTRFQETVNLLLKTTSPNIIPLFDYGANEEHFYLVLEHHKSPPLRTQLETQGALGIDAALSALQGMIGALDIAASQKIFHGLLSPLSVHISKTRGPMVIDLGLAQLIGGTRLPRALADDPYLAAFVAPEVRGGQPPDMLSDQYSLATMFYTMLTAKAPSARLWDDPAVAPYHEPLSQALSDNPTNRFAKMVDFYKALAAAKEQPQQVAPAAPTKPDPSFAPTKPVEHTKPIPPPATDRTVVELPVAELRKEAEKATPAPADRTIIEMPAVAPLSPKPVPTPVAPAAEHTIVELPVAELKKEAEKAAAAPVDRTMIEPRPAPSPAPVAPGADRTMVEMPIADLKKELEKAAPVDRTIVEMPAIVPPPAVPPAPPVQAAPVAEHTMLEMPIAELKKEAAKFVPPEPPAPEVERTMPEISIAEIQAAASPVDEPGVAEVEDEPDIPRRPSGELPPLDLPKKADKPAVKLEDTARPANKAPAAPPPREDVPPPYQPPKPARPAVLDATMPEMPAANLQPPPPPVQLGRTPGLDATMPEMPAMNYNPPPSSIPPAPYGNTNTPGSSVPYNFNTVQGKGGQNAGRQIDRRYRTGTIDKDSLTDPNQPSSDGLTGMIRSVPPASVRASANLEGEEPAPATRRTSPILWIILAIILLSVAMTIGVVVLKVLHVF
jgi:hypothetical protein